jgi:parvulin-like peptidyl-prolyl isomerase
VQGAAFAEVAKAKSDGFTAKDGGEHEWTTQGALKAAVIDKALFSLEVGQMSPILETDDGFHIVRVLERKEAGRRPFTEVQGEIRDRLKEERFQAAVKEYLSGLRRDARIWTAYTGNVSADVLLGRKPTETQQR